MNDQPVPLEDVLNDYVDANKKPSHAGLTEWCKRFPQYQQHLIQFTVAWITMGDPPTDKDDNEIDEAALVKRGMVIVRQVLDEMD